MTLRARLALFMAIATAAALLTQGILGYLSFQRLIIADLDRDLSAYLDRLIGQVKSDSINEYGNINASYENYVTRARVSRGSQVLFAWGDFPKDVPAEVAGRSSFGNWRVGMVQLDSKTSLQGAIYSHELSLGLKDYRQTLIFTLLLVSFLGAIAALFLSNRALRPLRHVLAISNKVAHSGDLSLRVPPQGVGELGELSQTFNKTMERLAAFRQRETEFTRNASHELRIPLTTMHLQITSFEHGYADPVETINSLKEEVERMTVLSESLLTLAREGRTQQVALDLADLARELASAAAIPYQGLKHLGFTGDPTLLRQALNNLIFNARKYAPNSETLVLLETRTKQADHFAVISVMDSGPGMSAEAMLRASEAFYRVPGTKVSGSGLGLSVVKRVAEVHGGWLELESNQPCGLIARIWVKLQPLEG